MTAEDLRRCARCGWTIADACQCEDPIATTDVPWLRNALLEMTEWRNNALGQQDTVTSELDYAQQKNVDYDRLVRRLDITLAMMREVIDAYWRIDGPVPSDAIGALIELRDLADTPPSSLLEQVRGALGNYQEAPTPAQAQACIEFLIALIGAS